MPSLEESTSDSAGQNPDPALQQWLISLNLDSGVIAKFILEDYRLDDVLNFMERDDLRRLNLRAGVELRLYRAIQEYRKSKMSQSDIEASGSSRG
ncbi:mitogen-activated protein kinase kinase kinase 15-like [Artemia franciscana]|uniref:mitogen-activated protein kinase kinase kinase 15-like n=1 Tax=Artemia franciscana TaxID=6661 RepID=UPI0032DAC84E